MKYIGHAAKVKANISKWKKFQNNFKEHIENEMNLRMRAIQNDEIGSLKCAMWYFCISFESLLFSAITRSTYKQMNNTSLLSIIALLHVTYFSVTCSFLNSNHTKIIGSPLWYKYKNMTMSICASINWNYHCTLETIFFKLEIQPDHWIIHAFVWLWSVSNSIQSISKW